jgi:tripartite-type tricarboxylate transporter receptor subunit TctC
MKLPHRRRFLHLVAGAAALPVVPHRAFGQAYPSRPVRLVVAFPAGLTPDIVARLVGQRLSERLGQQVVIENRPGAGGNIGTEAVVKALPDGYTLLLVGANNAISGTLYEKLNFNFIRDIAPVAGIGRTAFVLVINPSFSVKSVPEFIAYAKANPGKINMASAGSGTSPQLASELFKMMTGIDWVNVAYRGSLVPDLISGHVQGSITPVPTSLEYIKSGKLRALAVTSATRLEILPDIPALNEFVSGYEASGWYGVGAPAGTSTEIVERLAKDIRSVVADPDANARLIAVGLHPQFMASAEFGKLIAGDTERWGKVIRAANIKPE